MFGPWQAQPLPSRVRHGPDLEAGSSLSQAGNYYLRGRHDFKMLHPEPTKSLKVMC
jgi:hypothetical protein